MSSVLRFMAQMLKLVMDGLEMQTIRNVFLEGMADVIIAIILTRGLSYLKPGEALSPDLCAHRQAPTHGHFT